MSRIPINPTFLVHHKPMVCEQEFERVWVLIESQLTVNNDIASIDKPTWAALNRKQRLELARRFASVSPLSTTCQQLTKGSEVTQALPVVAKNAAFRRIFMAPSNVIDTLKDINESDRMRGQLLYDQEVHGPLVIPARVTLVRNDPDKPQVQAPRRTFVMGNNQIVYSPSFPAAGVHSAQHQAAAGSDDQSNNDDTKVTRPPNSWILFRADKHAVVKAANPGKSNNEICKCNRPYVQSRC